jgi:anaerobic C4-dicarboxylate transporter
MKLIHKLYCSVGIALTLSFIIGTIGIVYHGDVLNTRASNYEKDILSRELIIYWFIFNYGLLIIIFFFVEYLTVRNKKRTTFTDISLEMRQIKVSEEFSKKS